MIRVELSGAADADLAEILGYGTETFGQDRAEAYVASFQTTFDLIERHPLAGAVHDEVRPPIRSLRTAATAFSTTSLRAKSSYSASCTRQWMCSGTCEVSL